MHTLFGSSHLVKKYVHCEQFLCQTRFVLPSSPKGLSTMVCVLTRCSPAFHTTSIHTYKNAVTQECAHTAKYSHLQQIDVSNVLLHPRSTNQWVWRIDELTQQIPIILISLVAVVHLRMLIKVCRTGRERQTVSVSDNATVLALKKAIEQRAKIPIAEQNLTFNGLVLEDGKLLSDYGFFDNCTVLLFLRLGFKPDFELTILLPARKKLNLDVSQENTVGELKKLIEKKIGLKLTTAELIYDHWVLEDERKLIEYDITGGSTILLAHELRAGSSLDLRDSTHIRHAQTMPQSTSSCRPHQKRESALNTSSLEENDGEDEEEEDLKDLITVIFLAKTGSPIALRVHPSTPLGEVRGKLARVLHVSTNSMRFVRDGKSLDPAKTFAQYGISHGESVCLLSEAHIVENSRFCYSSEEENNEPKIRIIVQSKSGQTLACHVRGSTKIGTLKRRLEREVGVPRTRMGLFYQQKLLSDEALVGDYDLCDGALIYLRY